MKRVKLIFLIFIIITMILPYGMVQAEEIVTTSVDEDVTEETTEVNFKIVGESDFIQMQYVEDEVNGYEWIKIVDKRNGYEWNAYLDPTTVVSRGREPNALWSDIMNSLIYISYSNGKSQSSQSSGDDSVIATVREIDNGLSIDYNFTKQAIKIGIDIVVDEDSVLITIPHERMKEYADIKLMGIQLVPFMGASTNDDEGYILLPDGPGAIYNMAREKNSRYSSQVYSFDVYTSYFRNLDISSYEDIVGTFTKDQIDTIMKDNSRSAMIASYGIKKGDNAILLLVENGEHDSKVSFAPSGSVMDVNRVFCEFTYRRSYKDPRPDLEDLVTYFDKDYIEVDAEARYMFVAGEDADYSGMANICRKYISERYDLDRNKTFDAEIPLGLDLFSGVIKNQVLFSEYVNMTSFSEAKEIIEGLKESGAGDMYVNLNGSKAEGYGIYTEGYTPSSVIGGKAGLEDLLEYTNQNGVDVFIRDNFIDLISSNRGITIRNKYIKDQNQIAVSDDVKELFLLNPRIAFEDFSINYLQDLSDYAISGLAFDSLGQMIYKDYRRENLVEREETADYWAEMMNLSQEQFGKAAVEGGNVYVSSYADWMFDISLEDSKCFIVDDVVPFFAMVFHGLIDYSAQPGNLSYDYDYTKLKWIEFGCIPYFELTNNETELLQNTLYNKLYSSSYQMWKETIGDTMKEFNENLGSMWNYYIIEHENIAPNVYVITYETGDKVYINYNNESVEAQGITIEAMDYSVVYGGE